MLSLLPADGRDNASAVLAEMGTALGGYVRHMDSYSLGAARVLMPHIVASMEDLMSMHTTWDVLADADHAFSAANASTDPVYVLTNGPLVAAQKSGGMPGTRVVAIQNPYPMASFFLGTYYNEIGRPQDALRVLDAGLALPAAPMGLDSGETQQVLLGERGIALAALKRWDEEGCQQADFAALEWCMANGFRIIENRLAEILGNLPNRFVAYILKFLLQPLGARVLGPTDRVVHECAQLILDPSSARDRLTADLSHVDDDRGVARLETAFRLYVASEDVRKRLHAAHIHDWKEGVKKGVITQAEGEKFAAAHDAVMKVIEVDDFAPEALSPIYKKSADVHQFLQGLDEQRAAS